MSTIEYTRRERNTLRNLPGINSTWSFRERGSSSKTSLPLLKAVMTISGPHSDIVKQGYLGKQRQSHRRYFILRAGSHTGPSRIEWYKTKDKFVATDKLSSKTSLFSSDKQRVIYLRCCIGVSRTNHSKKDHAVTLYVKDQTLLLVMEDQWEQVEWYVSIKKLFDEEHEDTLEEEDDGYCTLPPAAFFKEVWPVTVKPRDLGRSKCLAGEVRLCLTASALTLIKIGAGNNWHSVKIPLMSVRRFGHLDGSFFLELGRSAPNGPGEIWMEARDQGNQTLAQNIHETVREAVKALRILPDFRSSPISNNNVRQAHLSTKYCTAKCRERSTHVRLLSLPAWKPDPQSSPTQWNVESCSPDASRVKSVFCSSPSAPEPDGYMDMKKDDKREGYCSSAVIEDNCAVAACGVEIWDSGEEEGMTDTMLSKDGLNSAVPSRDDYVAMDSPQRHNWSAHSLSASSLMMSVNSFTSVTCFDLSHPQYMKHKTFLSSTKTPDKAVQELTPTQGRHRFSFSQDFSSPKRRQDVSGTATKPITRTPHHSSPNHEGSFQDLTAVPEPIAVRRRCLSSCLRFCL